MELACSIPAVRLSLGYFRQIVYKHDSCQLVGLPTKSGHYCGDALKLGRYGQLRPILLALQLASAAGAAAETRD